MLPARKFNSRNIFPDFFNDFLENGLERVDATIPAINVMECDKGYNLELAAPGMTKDDFKVHVNKAGNLVIEMEKRSSTARSALVSCAPPLSSTRTASSHM